MLSKKQRIQREEVKKVISKGSGSNSVFFLIKKKENFLENNRFTVVVSKKVSNKAFERNLIKRRVKSSVATFFKENPPEKKYDFVFITKKEIKCIKTKDIHASLNLKKEFMLK